MCPSDDKSTPCRNRSLNKPSLYDRHRCYSFAGNPHPSCTWHSPVLACHLRKRSRPVHHTALRSLGSGRIPGVLGTMPPRPHFHRRAMHPIGPTAGSRHLFPTISSKTTTNDYVKIIHALDCYRDTLLIFQYFTKSKTNIVVHCMQYLCIIITARSRASNL